MGTDSLGLIFGPRINILDSSFSPLVQRASWWKWKRVKKTVLKFNIKKTKIMASSLITSWPIDGETMETVTDFIFLGSKNHCCHEIKMVALWRESYDKPRQHIKKQRHYFVNKGPSSQSYGFSSNHVWMWELDLKKAERQRIDAFELWRWRRHLRIPWTARWSNQSILKEISPDIHWKD